MNNTNQNLIEVLKESGLGQEEKKKLVQSINSMARDKILLTITKSLDDESAKELEQKLNQDTAPEEIMSFLKEKLPNLKEAIKEELNQLNQKIADFLQEE